jgi:hypothetical protein
MDIIKGYCESFCGMLGVYRHIYTVLRDTVRSNSRIKFLSQEPSSEKGFIGHQYSYPNY